MTFIMVKDQLTRIYMAVSESYLNKPLQEVISKKLLMGIYLFPPPFVINL